MFVHWSERFVRNFEDADWLDRHEAAGVLSSNSGRVILPEYLNKLVQRGMLCPQKINARMSRYQYKDVKYMVVRPESGRPPTDKPGANALRQRATEGVKL